MNLKKYLQKQRKNYMAERNLDFDKVINRKNTRCLKYDFAVKRGKPADVLLFGSQTWILRPLLILRMRW